MRTIFLFVLLLSGRWAAAQAPRSATVRAYLESPAPGAALLDAFTARLVVQGPAGNDTITQACPGTCRFEQLPLGSTLVFSAFKDDFPRDSVGTYDLVQISKHTKGESLLQTPYQYITADADCNGFLTNKDIVIIRSLILRIDTTTCVPWKLIDARALLPENPLLAPLPYTITVRDYDGGALDFSFLAVKTGNVSGYADYHPLAPPLPGTFVAAPLPNPTPGGAGRKGNWYGCE